MRSYSYSVAAALFFLLFGLSQPHAQPIARPYSFSMNVQDTAYSPWLDRLRSTSDTLIRLKLSSDGHIVSADGERVRLFGTTVTNTAQFLTAELATSLAKRLRKLGFNALKLYYNDYWNYDDGSFFRRLGPDGKVLPTSYGLNPAQLSRFDTLLHALRQEGIYVVLQLNSSHRFINADSVYFADSTYYNAYLHHLWDSRATALHRAWARTLLEHVNPLTGVRLADDPQIAIVNLTQENTLFWYWSLDRLNYIDEANKLNRGKSTISYHHSRQLDSLFNQHLIKKYGSHGKLLSAWSPGGVNATNLIENGSFEQFTSTAWVLQTRNNAAAALVQSDGGADSQTFVKVRIAAQGTNKGAGDIYVYNLSPRFGTDSLYELKFWAKMGYDASRPSVISRTMTLLVYQYNISSPRSLTATVTIDTAWKQYSYTFRSAVPGLQYVMLQLGAQMGDVWLDAFEVRQKAETAITPSESLANFTVRRLGYKDFGSYTRKRLIDQVQFYDSLETGYYQGLDRLLTDSVKYRGLINYTQNNYWALLPDIFKASRGDVMEYHTGWDYIGNRPGKPSSDSTFMVRNYSMVKSRSGGVFGALTANAVMRKAFIGEVTIPWMNQYHSEHMVLLPAFAAFQDWDGIFVGPYASYRQDLTANKMLNPYRDGSSANVIAKNPAMLSLAPFASRVFRDGLIASATVADSLIHDMPDIWLTPAFPSSRGMFGVEGGIDGNIATQMKLRQSFGGTRHKVAAEYPYLADTAVKRFDGGEILWDQTNGLFSVTTPFVYAGTGFWGSAGVSFPRMSLSREDDARDLLTFYMVSVDSSATLEESHLKLLSLTTRAQNSGLKWLPDSLSFEKDFGTAPTVLSAATVTLQLRSDRDSVILYPLDTTANMTSTRLIATRDVNDTTLFSITIDQSQTASPWYLIEEKVWTPVQSVGENSTVTVAISPNPATSTLRITGDYSSATVYDVLGHRVLEWSQPLENIDVSSLPTGSYTIELHTQGGRQQEQLQIMR